MTTTPVLITHEHPSIHPSILPLIEDMHGPSIWFHIHVTSNRQLFYCNKYQGVATADNVLPRQCHTVFGPHLLRPSHRGRSSAAGPTLNYLFLSFTFISLTGTVHEAHIKKKAQRVSMYWQNDNFGFALINLYFYRTACRVTIETMEIGRWAKANVSERAWLHARKSNTSSHGIQCHKLFHKVNPTLLRTQYYDYEIVECMSKVFFNIFIYIIKKIIVAPT